MQDNIPNEEFFFNRNYLLFSTYFH